MRGLNEPLTLGSEVSVNKPAETGIVNEILQRLSDARVVRWHERRGMRTQGVAADLYLLIAQHRERRRHVLLSGLHGSVDVDLVCERYYTMLRDSRYLRVEAGDLANCILSLLLKGSVDPQRGASDVGAPK